MLLSFSSRAFSSTTSFAALENGSGRNHGNFLIVLIVTGATAAAPGLLRSSRGGPTGRIRTGTADVLRWQKRRFIRELRTEKPPACRRSDVFFLPLWGLHGCFLRLELEFLLAVFILSSSSSSLLPL